LTFYHDILHPEKSVKLAQAYIPYQKYGNLLPIEEALSKGTIFADLYDPYPIIRTEKKSK